MKKKVLVIGGLGLTAALVGGWAVAQTANPGGVGPPFMHAKDGVAMGPGMMGHMGMEHMGQGMGHDMMKGHGMGPGMMKGMGPGMMHGRAGLGFADPAQIETLKTDLGITPAQEQAWSKYAKAVQDVAAAMKVTREGVDPQAVSKMTPADRFAFVTRMREQGQKQFESVKTAANELLATLDDSQKAKATDTLPGLAALGPPMMHGADMGGPQHRH